MKNLLVFTIDSNYIQPLFVALRSFIEFHDTSKYTIGILHSNLTDQEIKLTSDYAKSMKIDLITNKINDIFINIEVGYHFNSVIFYRFLIPSVFSNHKQVLYIDSDIIFMGNIDEIFNIDLKNNILAAIPRTFMGVPYHLKYIIKEYFASGLLLINIELFNKNHILNKMLKYLSNSSYKMPDQDALNATVKRWIKIDLRYGVETSFLYSTDPILEKAKRNPAIIQFSGSSKPWQYMNNHPYKNLYWYYLKKTPYRNYRYEDYSLIKAVKKYVTIPIKEAINKINGLPE